MVLLIKKELKKKFWLFVEKKINLKLNQNGIIFKKKSIVE